MLPNVEMDFAMAAPISAIDVLIYLGFADIGARPSAAIHVNNRLT